MLRSRWIAWLLFFVLLAPQVARAARCKQGLEMAYLVAASDAIVVIQIESAPYFQTQFVSFADYRFTVISTIKPALVASFKGPKNNILRMKSVKLGQIKVGQAYFAFLKYEQRGRWSASRCTLLPLTRVGAVRDACTVVSDLFKEKPYERERRCLLSYPPDVPFDELKQEFLKFLSKEYRYTGVARIADVADWVDGAAFQNISITLTARERKKFFPSSSLISSSEIRVYIPTSVLPSKEEYQTFMRKGKLVDIGGVWTMGSFVVEYLK